MAPRIALGLILLLGASACAMRESPYRFRAPVLSSVRAPALPPRHRVKPPPPPPEEPPPIEDPMAAPTYEPTSSLPAPHLGQGASFYLDERAKPALDIDLGGGVASALRALVGQRDSERTHLEFAVAALEAIGVHLGEEARPHTTGAAFLGWAESKGAVTRSAPLPGDLVVFDRVDGDEPASLIGVVVGPAPRDADTTEFVYLTRKVVRRGFVTPASPRSKRDDSGRALNTFILHQDGRTPRDTRFLSGELFRAFVRIDRLPQ